MRSWAMLLGAIIALLAVGCGGGGDSGGKAADTATQQAPTETTGGAAAQVSEVKMSEYKFAPSNVTAKAGSTITVPNAGSLSHDLKLRKGGKELGGTKLVDAGGSAKLKVDFPAGSYEMFCSVTGHEEQGMKGTFTVK